MSQEASLVFWPIDPPFCQTTSNMSILQCRMGCPECTFLWLVRDNYLSWCVIGQGRHTNTDNECTSDPCSVSRTNYNDMTLPSKKIVNMSCV